MAISKVEAVTYGAGLLSILAGIVYRKRNPEASTQALIFGTGTLLTGGAMSIQRARTQRRLSSMSGGRALGLNEKGTFKAGGQALSVWDDKEMGVQERVLLLQKQVKASVQDPTMRNLALAITGRATRDVRLDNEVLTVRGAGCADRDNLCELKAIYDWMKSNIRYTGDIGTHVQAPGKTDERNEPIDTFQSAARTVEYRGGDCLPAGTLLLVEGHRLVPIENVVPGSKIWGLDRWSDVQNVWYKGELPIDAIQLNNGSWIKATGDHKVYVALCKSHPVSWDGGKACSCSMDQREIVRIHVSELQPKMVLVTPDRIPFGVGDLDTDRAWIEGLYLADGWRSHDQDFDIAGRDGHPKEAQKHQVQEICARLGVATTWFEKSIRVRDAEWSRRVQQMGMHAPNKHALSIDLGEGPAGALLRGIMADSGANTHGNGRTFTTTSRELALQVRLLHKMFGVTCSERYIEMHGGLGQNPIWRLGVRDQARSDGHTEKLLRVKAIERGVAVVPVYDISTDDHYVYLPEADVTVSNCDDHATLAATLAINNGFAAKFRITSNTGETWDHIYTLAGTPAHDPDPKKWVVLDTTLSGNQFNKQPARKKQIDFAA